MLANVSIRAEIRRAVDTHLDAQKPGIRRAVIDLLLKVTEGGEGITMRDRLKASEILAKYSGLLTDRVEISAADGAKIQYIMLPETARE